MRTQSELLFQRLKHRIPGGVNSPFRAFDLVGGEPRVLERGRGARFWDVDGNEYLDLCGAWGPLVLGHAHPAVVAAVKAAAEDGVIFGAPNRYELELAEAVHRCLPSMESLRFVNSGAEAVMSSLRVARSVTRRTRIMKFEGCYHGHVGVLDSVGREATEQGGSLALGISPQASAETVIARFNDLESVEACFKKYPGEIACLITEPVTGSMGVIPPLPGFLEGLRELCDRHGALLIFDEVLTGFRVALGGAQGLYGVRPDLTCLGKALGGGLPVGAYGGRRELMERLSPLGPIYQAGTFCGNPVTMRAGLAALQVYSEPGFYERLDRLTERLQEGWRDFEPELVFQRVGSMFSVGFGVERLVDHKDAHQLDTERFSKFFHGLLEQGVYLPPSTWDAAAVSAAHTEADIDEILERAAKVGSSAKETRSKSGKI